MSAVVSLVVRLMSYRALVLFKRLCWIFGEALYSVFYWKLLCCFCCFAAFSLPNLWVGLLYRLLQAAVLVLWFCSLFFAESLGTLTLSFIASCCVGFVGFVAFSLLNLWVRLLYRLLQAAVLVWLFCSLFFFFFFRSLDQINGSSGSLRKGYRVLQVQKLPRYLSVYWPEFTPDNFL